MITKVDLKKINDYLWEIQAAYRKFMRVPARIYASEKILEDVEPNALEQIINVASLPGIVKYSLAMPDVHTGYGFVIGGVAATKLPEGVISPGGIGYDQNCGVRLLKTEYREQEITPFIGRLAEEMQRQVPSGLGKGHKTKLSITQIDKILESGVHYLVNQGYGGQQDIENCEANGRMEEADTTTVSEKAKNRGRSQLGTLGSGNHFLEIQKVEEIFNKGLADVFGLFEEQIVVMIHTGSRGLGHQNCSDYLKIVMKAMPKYGISLPDKELACVPFNSSEGQRFFKAMSAAANFAWSNRHMITYYTRHAWKNVLGKKVRLDLLYDVAHNIAKVEEHMINGERIKLCVHRKGATRAFPPGHPDIPEKYRETGQPVLIPGSMGTASYVLAGIKKGEEAFFSVAHGAGRRMSRHAARRKVSVSKLIEGLKKKGILVKSYSMRGIGEEAPIAYKDVDGVVNVVQGADLAQKVARLVPLAVIKGE